MAEQYLIYDETLSGIASAIRYKLDEATKYLPQEMYDAIMRISGESGIVDETMARMVAKNLYPSNASSMSVIDTQDSVFKIREYAFQSAYMTYASFPVCTEIGSNAFQEGWWEYDELKGGLVSVSFPICQSIYTRAFESCYKLSGVTFPSVVYMESWAFENCDHASLASFPLLESIPEYTFRYFGRNVSSVTAYFPKCVYIGSSAFAEAGITSVSFPVCESIYASAFYLCEELSSVSFPKCTRIGAYAFYGDQSLARVSIPLCSSIGSYTFRNDYALTSISAPELQYIGSSAFAGCTALPSVSFPACISILSTAFYGCTNLSVARFGGNLTIGSSAFRSCGVLSSLYLTGSSVASLVEAVASTFRGCPIYDQSSSARIYVPSSLVSAYKSAQYWSAISGEFVSI